MMRPRFLVLGVSLLFGLAPADASGQVGSGLPSRLEPISFRIGETEVAAEAGTVGVPMVRSRPDSPTIELRLVRFPAVGDRAGSPIVYLAGGPGGSGIAAARGDRAEFLQSLRVFGDVIAFDQRGTGNSGPELRACQCSVLLPFDEPGDPEAFLGPLRASVAACVESLRAAGTDVSGFTTAESADDLDALRQALGAERLTLVGVSYGTHLALAMARRHPERVDRMVLAGVEGLDQTLKLPGDVQANLERVALAIQHDPAYATRLPDPLAVIDSLLARLAREPVRVGVRSGTEVTVGRWDLQKFLADGMGSEDELRLLPARLLAMSRGDFSELGRWAHVWRRPLPVLAMSEAMDCASYASPARLERVRREAGETLLGATIDYPMPGICEIDGLPRLEEPFREPLERSIPTLFISGTLDGRTPVSNAEEIAAGFPNARHLILGNVSHGEDLLIASPEIQDVVHAFLAGTDLPTLRIDLPAWSFEP